ncbi:hypothetical protein NDU88_004500 [Pleurodeles waltl]|uniref:Uncharacterized protein n=1 Tax=Pleurodeles waltl TaxID=8319 RepID=A0AAV7MXD5_PLEWA|nr:hypothetical protein NDU88_004500 [Pleurodeles waltl]
MNTRPALRRPAALEEQEGPGAERLSENPGLRRRNLVRTGETESGGVWRVTAPGRGALAGLRAEGVQRRPEVRAPKKHSSKDASGASGSHCAAPRNRKEMAEARNRRPGNPRREVAEPGPNRRDRERSGLAGDDAGAGGRSLGRRSAEGVLWRPEERTPKKHSNKEAGGVSGPRPPDNRAQSRGRENTGSDPLDT